MMIMRQDLMSAVLCELERCVGLDENSQHQAAPGKAVFELSPIEGNNRNEVNLTSSLVYTSYMSSPDSVRHTCSINLAACHGALSLCVAAAQLGL